MNEIIRMTLIIFVAGFLILGYMFMENVGAIVSRKIRSLLDYVKKRPDR